jgi:hypothetical protein
LVCTPEAQPRLAAASNTIPHPNPRIENDPVFNLDSPSCLQKKETTACLTLTNNRRRFKMLHPCCLHICGVIDAPLNPWISILLEGLVK